MRARLGPRAVTSIAAAILLAACAPAAPTGSPTGAIESFAPIVTAVPSLDEMPVFDTADDGRFRVRVSAPQSQALTTTALLPRAEFVFLGPEASIQIFHGAPLVVWRIRDVAGTREMSGGVDTICIESELTRDRELVQDFMKSGEITDDPTVGFDRAWYEQRQLKLPAGRWAISATLDLWLGGCGLEHHVVESTIEVEVRR